jgi:hypothetical protein
MTPEQRKRRRDAIRAAWDDPLRLAIARASASRNFDGRRVGNHTPETRERMRASQRLRRIRERPHYALWFWDAP